MSAQSFTFKAGEDLEIEIPVYDENGDAADLTGATARFVLARTVGGTLLIDSDADGSAATKGTGGSAHVVTVTIPDTLTDSLVGTYSWELKLVGLAGGEKVAAYGYATAQASMTSGS